MRTLAILPSQELRRRQAAPAEALGERLAPGARSGHVRRRAHLAAARRGTRGDRRRDPRQDRGGGRAASDAEVICDDEEAGPVRGRAGRHPPRAGRGLRARAARARRHPAARPRRADRAARARRGRRLGVVIVPDRHGTGTNALLLSSARRDRAELRARAAASATWQAAAGGGRALTGSSRSARLPLDVDTPEDLAELARPARASVAASAPAHARRAAPARPLAGAHPPAARRACRPELVRRRAAGAAARGARRATTSPRCSRRPRPPTWRAATCWWSRTRSCRRPRAASAASTTSSRASAPRRSPRSTARTRASCRPCSTSPAELLRAERGVLICVTRHGFVCANAGVDQSNGRRDGELVLLPEDPDASARAAARRHRGRARRPPGGGDRRLLRPRLAPRARPTSRSAPPASRRSTTGAAGPTRFGRELRATTIADRRRRRGGGRPGAREGLARAGRAGARARALRDRRRRPGRRGAAAAGGPGLVSVVQAAGARGAMLSGALRAARRDHHPPPTHEHAEQAGAGRTCQ